MGEHDAAVRPHDEVVSYGGVALPELCPGDLQAGVREDTVRCSTSGVTDREENMWNSSARFTDCREAREMDRMSIT